MPHAKFGPAVVKTVAVHNERKKQTEDKTQIHFSPLIPNVLRYGMC